MSDTEEPKADARLFRYEDRRVIRLSPDPETGERRVFYRAGPEGEEQLLSCSIDEALTQGMIVVVDEPLPLEEAGPDEPPLLDPPRPYPR